MDKKHYWDLRVREATVVDLISLMVLREKTKWQINAPKRPGIQFNIRLCKEIVNQCDYSKTLILKKVKLDAEFVDGLNYTNIGMSNDVDPTRLKRALLDLVV